MASPHEIAAQNIVKLQKFQSLHVQGLARPEEEQEAFAIAKETAKLFTNDILKRKAEKLAATTIWTNQSRDGFLSASERKELNQWIELITEFVDARKIKTSISNDSTHIQSVVDGEDQHIFITQKGSDQHAHLIIDGGTGEVRIDPNDQAPHELIESVETTLRLKDGQSVNVTRTSMNFADKPIKTDVRVYVSKKEGYSSIEVYNAGQEDLEKFTVEIKWKQEVEGPQSRVIEAFFEEQQSMLHAIPAGLNMLRTGARVYGHVPGASEDGELLVIVKCVGMQTGTVFEREYQLEIGRTKR